jgi:hypothetical protein
MRQGVILGSFISTLILTVAGASAQTWGRPATPSLGACFYERPNYGGQYFCVNVGESKALVPAGTNDRISSIRVFGSAEVIVYPDANYHGTSRRFEVDISDLREVGFNDKISSYSVGRRGYGSMGNWGSGPFPGSGACFYQNPNFNGQYFCANVGAYTPEMPQGTNDEVSSIRLFGSASVTVFQDARGEGRSQRFDSDVRDLRNIGWNDLISSFRVTPRGGGPGGGGGNRGVSSGLRVFGDINYKGRSATLGENTPNVGDHGMGATISSIRVPAGETWQVCTGQNFTGRCQTLTGDQSDLRRGDWNDVIASVRRIR